MSIFWASFYGIIQGLTEFLPISSSGHLSIAQNIFGLDIPTEEMLSFDVLLHIGTLIAVFIFYGRDIFSLIPAFFSGIGKLLRRTQNKKEYTDQERLVFFLLVSTLPLSFAPLLEGAVAYVGIRTKLIGLILIANGILLFASDKAKSERVDQKNQKLSHAISVGLTQLLAVFPGLSRSGATVSSGLFSGFKREYAVKYSFLLSIPAIIGANVLSLPELLSTGIESTSVLPYFWGTVASALTGIASMKIIIYISKKSNFRIFSYYCWAVGLLAIVFG